MCTQVVVGITVVVTRLSHYRTIFDWLLQMSYSTFVSWKLIAAAVFAFSSIVPLESAVFSNYIYAYATVNPRQEAPWLITEGGL